MLRNTNLAVKMDFCVKTIFLLNDEADHFIQRFSSEIKKFIGKKGRIYCIVIINDLNGARFQILVKQRSSVLDRINLS